MDQSTACTGWHCGDKSWYFSLNKERQLEITGQCFKQILSPIQFSENKGWFESLVKCKKDKTLLIGTRNLSCEGKKSNPKEGQLHGLWMQQYECDKLQGAGQQGDFPPGSCDRC